MYVKIFKTTKVIANLAKHVDTKTLKHELINGHILANCVHFQTLLDYPF